MKKIFTKMVGPSLSLIAFVLAYYIDPLANGTGQNAALASIPAFLLSVIILLISQNISTAGEIEKATSEAEQTQNAVKNHLHATEVGSPEFAMEYITTRMSSLREVKNTSFNVPDELERANEKFYLTPVYQKLSNSIASFSSKRLIWKDLGDRHAIDRFREHFKASGVDSNYSYKLINYSDPQINFIILEYFNGDKEVLFNWDFRNGGHDPVVLLTRESKLLDLFVTHFDQLRAKASDDHDLEAMTTKSTSQK